MFNIKLPKDFYWKTYLTINKDLTNNLSTKEEAERHYLKYGINENRIYNLDFNKLPDDFDWKLYLELNSDLIGVKNKNEAKKHYILYGINENRIYKLDFNKLPDDFDWKIYLEINDDLIGVKNENEAKKHYILYGIKENRKYKLNTNLLLSDTKLPVTDTVPEQQFSEKKIENLLNNQYDFLYDNEVLLTKGFSFKNEKFLSQTVDIDILKNILYFVLVIDFNNGGGGSTIFLNRIVSKYKNYNTFLIVRFDGTYYSLNLNEEILIDDKLDIIQLTKIIEQYKTKCKKIFINHFLGYEKKFIDYIFNLNIHKIGITHDYYNIFDNPQPLFINIEKTNKNLLIDINQYDTLITQNIFNYEFFSKYYKKNIDITELPDFRHKDKRIDTSNKKKICCIIGNINEIKGSNNFEKMYKLFSKKYIDVEFVVIGYINCKNFENFNTYNSMEDFNNLLLKYKPNIIIELSIWPETYCYTLTLSMITDLPILYLKKPDKSVIKNRLNNYDKAYEFDSIDTLYQLICRHSQNYFYTINPIISYDKYWNDLFVDKTEKKITIKNYKNGVKPYFIYFPQFYEFHENNINFYQGYTDIKNLKLLNDSEIYKKEIPSSEYCNIDDYDYILNKNLIQKQMNLINEYGFEGLAIYYYWFTENNFTNKNMIMEKVIDQFFYQKINMHNKKVFFIWANENWSDNLALNPNNMKNIKNMYDEVSFKKNSENLIKYFRHKNYLKIDNKPVLFIYHSYLIDNIDNFYDILNYICIKNDFDGVHLVVNSFEKEYKKYKNFYINFNYKKYDCRFFDKVDKKIFLDYQKYVNDPYHFKKDKIQTIVFDFKNQARLFKPNNLKLSTTCINNTELYKTIFTKNLIDLYIDSKTELDKILLVNSLNEWGENMAFEPSDKYGYYNINLLKDLL
jgi:hypothetical protein